MQQGNDMTTNTTMNLAHIPFSRYGSYMAVNRDSSLQNLMVHYVQRRFGEDKAFLLNFHNDGDAVDCVCDMHPHYLSVKAGNGSATIFVRDDHTIAIEAEGIDMTFVSQTKHGYGTRYGENEFGVISTNQRTFTRFYLLEGQGALDGPYRPVNGRPDAKVNHARDLDVRQSNGRISLLISIHNTEQLIEPKPIDATTEIAAAKNEWDAFLETMPTPQSGVSDFTVATWYTLWSSFVRREDVYHYDAMLMSKKGMCSLWSWDHCFNALAMTKVGKRVALEQFLLPFEVQAECGALPDMINPNHEIVWGVTKPPIHGWCFSAMMDEFEFDDEELKKVYDHLVLWTNWWMDYRDSDGDGIPEYPQGCDSGWDNSTLFDGGYYLESPDLSAFLVLQMKALNRIATALGMTAEATTWCASAKALLSRLYKHSWVDGRFVAKFSGSHDYDPAPTSLLTLMPIVLGEHLDEDKMSRMVQMLEDDFLTENGPATESPSSPLYLDDGYWRGPIWAPSTYLIVDGLRRAGRTELAERIARSFCNMVEHKAEGQYENFDALTGEGLRAPGYTWTASVYMLLKWMR
jgi:putative isomerase